MKIWKVELERYMKKICKGNNCLFCGYKSRTDISENLKFFLDESHLNTISARCMTSIIERGFEIKL